MGSSHSNAASNLTNNMLNTNDISNINKSVVESAINALIKNASSCSSAVNQNNNCSINNSTVKGNFNLGGNQSNKASVNFSCVQSSSAHAEMASAMSQSLQGELKAISGTEAAGKLNAAAEASNKSGFGGWGGGNADSNTSTNVNNNITNQTKATIENMYEQNLKNNFNSETVNECIGKTTQQNNISAEGDIIGGNANVECNQSNSLEQVQECKQLAEAANNTLQKTAQELGFTVIVENESSTKNELTANSKTKNESTGPIEELGGAISGVVGSIGNLFGLASLGIAAPFIIWCCCICCCILLSCASSLMVAKSGAGTTGTSSNFNIPKDIGKYGKLKGGYSDTEYADSIEYLGLLGISMVSDIVSDSSPFF